jgi:hypothetical protein
VLARLAGALDLQALLVPLDGTPRRAVACAMHDSLVVVTGRRETVQDVVRSAPAKVVGAAGGCAVVAGLDATSVGRLAAALSSVSPADSCTELGGAFAIERWTEDAPTASVGGASASMPALADVLSSLHPSVVFTPACSPPPPEFIRGYRVIPCDESGGATTLMGFGADPVFGWPGDHVV